MPSSTVQNIANSLKKVSMKWAEMTPEQRDRFVAERVMDWHAKECDGEMGEKSISSDGWFCQRCGHDGYWGDDFTHEEKPPHYTQSLDAAWLVLKRFYEDNPDGELFSSLAYHLKVTWYEQAYNANVFQMNLEQLVNLTPEKLCLAILKASVIKVE